MKINWKVRLKNKYFIIPMVTVIITAVYQIMMLCEIAPVIQQENLLYMINLIIDALCAIGIVVDNTTPGFGDSQLVMSRGEEEAEPNEL